jgi:hypothetical protein
MFVSGKVKEWRIILTWILPKHPDKVFEIPCAISSRLTLRLSSLTAAPKAGTLIGTWMMPKKDRANMVGMVLASAAPSMLPNSEKC